MNPKRKLFGRPYDQLMKDRPLGRAFPLFEVMDGFFYSPGQVTAGPTHIRDAIDFKRMMSTVMVALLPCILMAMYNTGYQANAAMASMGVAGAAGWRGFLLDLFQIGYNPGNILACLVHGLLYFLPLYVVTMVVGIGWEIVFAIVRRHEVQEGFFVTGLLIPLILPATVPLWQVVIAVSFAVVIGKEIFGGTGRNWLNPALAARAFLFFAYPAEISGDACWTAVDGFSGATPLALAAEGGLAQIDISWGQAFLGQVQGSMGETSALACLIGAFILVVSGIGSWRIMAGTIGGAAAIWGLLYAVGSGTNPMFGLPFHWHLVLGGFAFGLVFMATDPVSAAVTDRGKWIYGALIGVLVMVVRIINPAFPEGMMLAILFGNVFAPLIDYYVVRANKRRRVLRHA